MIGAMIGDIVGSIYEFNNIRTKNFILFDPLSFFTDDSIMTFAVAEALRKTAKNNYKNLSNQVILEMRKYGKIYPDASYGLGFKRWINSPERALKDSLGNGSAMRVSAVPYFSNSLEEVEKLSDEVTKVSHNHIEGLKGAKATAICIWLALQNKSKIEIKKYIEDNYYSLDFDYEDLKKNYQFNETCQNTVPQAIFCFLISTDFEDCLRTSISIGGDSDTLCAISCAIAEAFYGVPKNIHDCAVKYFDKRLSKLYNKYYKKSSIIIE